MITVDKMRLKGIYEKCYLCILPLQQSGINNIIYTLLLNMEYLYG